VLRVAASTVDDRGNPYVRLLYAALRTHGIAVQQADLNPRRLYSQTTTYDVLHIHWPEHILVSPGANHTRMVSAALALRASVRLLRARDVRIVWTAHNIRPHNPDAPRAQVSLYRWLASDADAVIVHTHYAAQLVRQRLGRVGSLYLARHGNYIGAYGNPILDRDTLRVRHGFAPSDHVLLAFGQIRAYTRLVELARDFEAHAPPSTYLLIAGAPDDPEVTHRLRAMAAANDHIVLLDRRIPDSEVSELYAVADLAVFNYSELFSSGALVLAFSMGLAALAPQIGSADGIARRPALFGWNRSPFEVLADALQCSPETRQSAALATARAHGWADSARVHVQAYEGSPPNLP
jgi:beta-1,4-mannosyltransferase